MRILSLALCFLFAAVATAERVGPDYLLGGYIVNLTLDDSEIPFYGNALLVHKNETHLFYATNYHVIPENAGLRAQLRAEGPITNNVPFRATVVGLDPGMDLALISIPQGGPIMAQPEFKNFQVQLPENVPAAASPGLSTTRSYRMAILGANGGRRQFGMEWADLVWHKEMKQFSSWTAFHEAMNAADMSVDAPVDLSVDKIWIETTSDCPIVFLRQCYRVPLRSQGFSGSVLMVSDKDAPDFRVDPLSVVGLVSHYSVYTGDTYIVPMDSVQRVSSRLLQKAQANGFKDIVWNLRDESGTFEWISPTAIKIVGDIHAKTKLPLGTIIASTHSRVGGGGPSTGGGGPSTGGGGPSTGGGGPSTGGGISVPLTPNASGWILPDGSPQATGLFDLPRLWAEVSQPEKWGSAGSQLSYLLSANPYLRGTHTLLNFKPGVQIGSDSTLRSEWAGSQTWTVQNFVHAYLGQTEKNFVPFPAAHSRLPAEMGLVPETGFGAIYPVSLQELTHYSEANDPKQLTESEHRLWKMRQQATARGERFPNIVGARSTYPTKLAVDAASLIRKNGTVSLTLSAPIWGRIQLEFPDRFTAQGGDRYEYRGPVAAKELFPVYPFPNAQFYGVISLQKDFTRPELELRVLLVTKIAERPHLVGSAMELDLWREGVHTGPWGLALGIFVPVTAGAQVEIPPGPSAAELEKRLTEAQRNLLKRIDEPDFKKAQAEHEKRQP